MQQFQPSLFPSYPGMPQQQQQQQYPLPSAYPPPVNIFQRSVSPVAPAMPTSAASAAAAPFAHAEASPLEEFEKLWDVVIDSPNKFEYWEALVQYTSHIGKKNTTHYI